MTEHFKTKLIMFFPPLLIYLLLATVLTSCTTTLSNIDVFRDKLITIGTSTRSGTHNGIGSAFCDAVNQDRSTSLIRCVTYSTIGAQYNAKAAAYGELTMGFTSSNIAYTNFHEQKKETRGAQLRAVMSLYSMPVMIVARRDINITDATQIAGHSFNIGNMGSGHRAVAEMLMKNMNLTPADFSKVTELNVTSMGQAFCKGEIDIIVQSFGNPSRFYKKLIEKCGGVIVKFPPKLIKTILTNNPRMTPLIIASGLYNGHDRPIQSFGYKALLVTRADVSNESIVRFLTSVMKRLPDIKNLIPELSTLNPDKMFSKGIPIPLHPGVNKYLKLL